MAEDSINQLRAQIRAELIAELREQDTHAQLAALRTEIQSLRAEIAAQSRGVITYYPVQPVPWVPPVVPVNPWYRPYTFPTVTIGTIDTNSTPKTTTSTVIVNTDDSNWSYTAQ